MKTMHFLAMFLLAGVTSGAGAAVAAQAPAAPSATAADPDADLKPLVVIHSLKAETYIAPQMSAALQLAVILSGRVRVAVQADQKGRPVDWLVLAYTNRSLADSTTMVLNRWRFEPVKIEGHAVCAQTEFDIEFRGPDVVTISPAMDQLAFAFRNMGIERVEYQPCPLDELDRIPLLLNVVKPLYSIDARNHGVRGSVEVQFYINEKGEVRLPAAINADRIDLAMAALDAVRQWKFEPPTRNGRPVLISAIQHFDFGTDTSTTTIN